MATLFPKTISYDVISFTRDAKGRPSQSVVSSTFQGSVQPVTGKDLESLPIGRKDIGTVKVYSSTSLNVSVEGSDKSGDVVYWQGKKYEIIQAMDFQNDLINHYKYIAQFVGEE